MDAINIKSGKRVEMIDITAQIQISVTQHKIEQGVCYVFIPHTTAAITINENADPDVTKDLIMELNKLVPFEDGYQHLEGNSAAHLKASIMGFSEIILIENGKLVLGTWQGVYFCEFDGPRERKVVVKVV